MWRLNLFRRACEFRFTRPTLACDTEWGATLEAHANDVVGNWLYFFGHYQKSLCELIRREVRAGDGVLDLGAHVGVFTTLLASRVGAAGRVYAVEPAPRNLELLERNLDRNGFAARVTLAKCAVSDYCGTGGLREDAAGRDWGGVSLAPGGAGGCGPVVVKTIDALWREWGRPRLAFVKMDVEGAEPAVLAGARELLAGAPPRLWVVEFNMTHLSRADAEALWNRFREGGYAAYDLKMRPLDRPPEADADVVFLAAP